MNPDSGRPYPRNPPPRERPRPPAFQRVDPALDIRRTNRFIIYISKFPAKNLKISRQKKIPAKYSKQVTPGSVLPGLGQARRRILTWTRHVSGSLSRRSSTRTLQPTSSAHRQTGTQTRRPTNSGPARRRYSTRTRCGTTWSTRCSGGRSGHCSSRPRSAPLDRSPRRCSSTTPYKAHFSYNARELEPPGFGKRGKGRKNKNCPSIATISESYCKRGLGFH
jgi:hypothetical protein